MLDNAVVLQLVERIKILIPRYPYIMDIKSPWSMIDVPGFSCADLRPSFEELEFAIEQAQQEWRQKPNEKTKPK